MMAKILVIGKGAREDAISWKLRQSAAVEEIYAAPGNGGTEQRAENIPLDVMDIKGLAKFALDKQVDLTVVGPENPLAAGLVDAFQGQGLAIFGPGQRAALLESSKAFAKTFMGLNGINTASYKVFNNYNQALDYLSGAAFPKVIKASGLAAGKGVYICRSANEAELALKEIFIDKKHGRAGDKVIIEEFLAGREVSIQAFCDGQHFRLMSPIQDYKRVGDHNQGANTGGMGACGPLPWLTDRNLEAIGAEIVGPTLAVLKSIQAPFVGCLYSGLIKTARGIFVLEYNVRFGDPEAQVLMRLLKSDLYEIIQACLNGKLAETSIEWQPGYAVCLVLASAGYPEEYQTGLPITGIEQAEQLPGLAVFHGGTVRQGKRLLTSGGRVLSITAVAETLAVARERVYAAAAEIDYSGKYLRQDIAADV